MNTGLRYTLNRQHLHPSNHIYYRNLPTVEVNDILIRMGFKLVHVVSYGTKYDLFKFISKYGEIFSRDTDGTKAHIYDIGVNWDAEGKYIQVAVDKKLDTTSQGCTIAMTTEQRVSYIIKQR